MRTLLGCKESSDCPLQRHQADQFGRRKPQQCFSRDGWDVQSHQWLSARMKIWKNIQTVTLLHDANNIDESKMHLSLSMLLSFQTCTLSFSAWKGALNKEGVQESARLKECLQAHEELLCLLLINGSVPISPIKSGAKVIEMKANWNVIRNTWDRRMIGCSYLYNSAIDCNLMREN